MEHTNHVILIGALVILLSILAGQISRRLGAPVLLTFLGMGILFGEDGLGGIVFNDKSTAFLICSIALAMILFDSGLRTPIGIFKRAIKPALSLSTLGVLITATITGGFATYLMGWSFVHGMLLGSIVASTDAAAVFLLLHQRDMRLKERVSATLEVESGINDPMSIFLTITCVNLITAGAAPDWFSILGTFLRQMGLGLVIGYAGGVGIVRLLRFLRLDITLYPAVVLAGGLLIFAGANAVEGSGFLAVYIAGVTFANVGYQKFLHIKQFNDGMAWIAQLVMLLTLGLLVTPTTLVEYILPATLIVIVLIVVARPVAVWCCLPTGHFNWREKTFISWVGLRGAIPIYLALIPTLSGVENGQHYFNIAFIIVLASLIAQGWAINPLARKLKIVEETSSTEAP